MNNNALTYLLYGVLIVLIASAGYKACEMKKIQQATAAEQKELERTLSDRGYLEQDSTGQSRYVGENTDAAPSTPSDANGIEYDEQPVREPAKQEKPVEKAQPSAAKPPSQPAYVPPASSSISDLRDLDNDTRTYRYRVVAGSFSKIEGARRRLEEVIQLGYQDAEIGAIRGGTLAQVVVKRTDNLGVANKIRDDLKARKIDAGIVDRNKK
jgi:cell division protein FtsN